MSTHVRILAMVAFSALLACRSLGTPPPSPALTAAQPTITHAGCEGSEIGRITIRQDADAAARSVSIVQRDGRWLRPLPDRMIIEGPCVGMITKMRFGLIFGLADGRYARSGGQGSLVTFQADRPSEPDFLPFLANIADLTRMHGTLIDTTLVETRGTGGDARSEYLGVWQNGPSVTVAKFSFMNGHMSGPAEILFESPGQARAISILPGVDTNGGRISLLLGRSATHLDVINLSWNGDRPVSLH
jgi:hypothetical protein